MKRHKHSLSHYHLLSADLGKLYPVSCVEVMMGDVLRGSSSALVRVSPLLAPVMHPVQVKLHHWFVPARLLWAGWEDFVTGGPDGLGGSAGAYPTIATPGGGFPAKSLADYLGIPPSVAATQTVAAMPFRAYNMIWNENYRDQDLQTELAVPTTSGNDTTSPTIVQFAGWGKDYFGTARPWPQKGPNVTLPLGTTAPLLPATPNVVSNAAAINMRGGTGSLTTVQTTGGAGANVTSTGATTGTSPWNFGADGASTTGLRLQSGVVADLSTATAATVSALREAMALQRYEEARAQWGSRYVEYLRYYGIRSSDARLQRPEYLGGGKSTISFSEVLQTSDSGAVAGVGDMYGHGIAAVRSRPYVRFFEEHGYVFTLMCVRPVPMYQQGLHRMWLRRIKEDYYTKELELIGQQEIQRREIFSEAGAPGDTIFGYQDRYREYCEQPSYVSGEMRSTLDFWHMARQFAAAPALNAAFITCDPEKRNFQVSTNDVLWVMVNNNIRARRMVQRNPVARIL